MEKTLILVRGVSGAGKSTLAGIFENLGSFTTILLGPDYGFDIRNTQSPSLDGLFFYIISVANKALI